MAVPRKAGATWVIPTEDEWYKAAYHKNDGATRHYWDYPTSSDNTPSDDLVEPTDPGNNATMSNGIGYTTGGPYYRTEVGAHENSESPYGTFDQGGNVWEWNETEIGSWRGVRGGAWCDIPDYLLASYRYDGYNTSTYQAHTIGFRVARVPEPGSITILLGLALTALLYYWRKHV
jgi:formylglycine-generating enzyme required for sulfatase activity